MSSILHPAKSLFTIYDHVSPFVALVLRVYTFTPFNLCQLSVNILLFGQGPRQSPLPGATTLLWYGDGNSPNTRPPLGVRNLWIRLFNHGPGPLICLPPLSDPSFTDPLPVVESRTPPERLLPYEGTLEFITPTLPVNRLTSFSKGPPTSRSRFRDLRLHEPH